MIRRTILLTIATSCIATALLHAQVSSERIVRAGQEPQNWLTYSGNYNGYIEMRANNRLEKDLRPARRACRSRPLSLLR